MHGVAERQVLQLVVGNYNGPRMRTHTRTFQLQGRMLPPATRPLLVVSGESGEPRAMPFSSSTLRIHA